MKLKIFKTKNGYQLKIFKNSEWYILIESKTLSYCYTKARLVSESIGIKSINLVKFNSLSSI